MIDFEAEIIDKEAGIFEASKVLTALKHINQLNLKLTNNSGERPFINAAGGSLWFFCDNREDLKVLLSIVSGAWNKSTSGEEIRYSNTLFGAPICVFAKDSALPETCHVVEEVKEIPAQPATTRIIRTIQCNIPTHETL
jgi:hypothetical protein